MTNNLRKVAQDLRTFAKRTKDFKFTNSALITFILTRMTFAANSPDTGIQSQAKQLNTSISQSRADLKKARKETDKLINGANLELIQLMEQGEHITKPAWGSWQFGTGYTYNNWMGRYNGRGNKNRDNENRVFARALGRNRFIQSTTGGKYGATDLELTDTAEPSIEITVSAAIRPKSINKQAPLINLPAIATPTLPTLNVSMPSPAVVTPNAPVGPNLNLTIPEPDANPFANFDGTWTEYISGMPCGNSCWNTHTEDAFLPYSYGVAHSSFFGMAQNVDITDGLFWSGMARNPHTGEWEVSNTAGYENVTQDTSHFAGNNFLSARNFDTRNSKLIFSIGGRWLGSQGNKITGGKYHLAGNVNNITDNAAEGTALLHVVGDFEISDAEINLYGKAGIMDAEAYRGGQFTMNNLTVNILGDRNTLFRLHGRNAGQDASSFSGGQYSTKLSGNARITADTRGNTAYAVVNYAGGLRLENLDSITFNGASNIGFSFLTWVPDKSKYIATTYLNYMNGGIDGEGSLDAYIPYVKTLASKPFNMYGDENVGIFFNKKTSGYNVGIHEGYFELYMNIGTMLNSNPLLTQQTVKGNLETNSHGNPTGYTADKVDANVGVFAISGQRDGVSNTSLSSNAYHNNNQNIKDLKFEKFDIKFGKYSKNGFMFLAKNGTVIDIQTGTQTQFSDGKDGITTKETEAGEGTVINYAEGTWTTTDTGLTEITAGTIQDKPTEIKVNQNLNMMSKNGKAFYAKAGGLVTVNADAKAYGYGSIIGLAESGAGGTTHGATVNINADITAIDDITVDTSLPNRTNIVKAQKFKNIGGYAKSHNGKDTVVNVAAGKNVTVNGIGAYAEGEGAKVSLNGTGNTINTGTNGGLYAASKGIVEFGGGTIVNKDQGTAVDPVTGDALLDADDNPINDHKNTIPFYAKTEMVDHDGNPLTPDIPVSGKIVFKDTDGNASNPDTLIEMYDGILVYGKSSDYLAGIDSTSSAKYQGMNNVKVRLMNHGVNLGVFEELTPIWDGNDATYLATLRAIPKFKEIDANGKKYVTTLTKGTLTLDTNVNLSSSTDKFNDILMEREKVVIKTGKTVTGTRKGLSMGSNALASSNSESGYTNKGTVNITGGTVTEGVAAVNVAFGTVHNESTGTLSVDNGAGIYGTNGSRLVNDGTINVTGTGAGIAGLSKGSVTYGNKKVDITNNGTISIAGDNAIGIFAYNNDNAAQSDVVINSNSALSLGTNGVGIAVKGSNGGVINLGGTGNITVGTGGIGIYAENSRINLNADVQIETKENGVGIYTAGTSQTFGAGKTLTYKYSGAATGTGIASIYSGASSSNNMNIVLDNSVNTAGGMVGILAKGGGTFTNTGSISGTSSGRELAVISENTAVANSGSITLGNATSLNDANVGIYAKTDNAVANTGNITAGSNSIGIYGYAVSNTGNITAGSNGMGIYSQGGDLSLGGEITVGGNEAVAVFTQGTGQNISSTAKLNIGDGSYGFVVRGSGTVLTLDNANGYTAGNDTVYAYSADTSSQVTNRTNLTSTGKNNYGLYTSGTTRNYGNIDFSSSTGNVGIYAVEGYAANGDDTVRPVIKVSGSDITSRNPDEKYYGIGMAAGYLNEKRGTVENFGTIQVTKDGSIGMYASGTGSRAINRGTIELSGKGVVGMYLDNNAVGENYGVIRTVPNAENNGIVGVAALNGSFLKNYGQIVIESPESVGVYHTGGTLQEEAGSSIAVTGEDSERTRTSVLTDTSKGVKGIHINTAAPGVRTLDLGGGSSVVTRLGQPVNPVRVDTTIASPNATQVRVGNTVLDISQFNVPNANAGELSREIGMYVDTSGVRYTNPIQGIENLTGLKKVNLIFGIEASRYTDSKDIEIGQNILAPYNEAITEVSLRRIGSDMKWLTKAASLTWIATPVQNNDQTLSKVYLSKIPYVSFAKDEDTYSFMDGLEQRYGVEGRGSLERRIFEKLNDIGKGEAHIFAQAVDEMKGHQYANIQQRTYSTGKVLDNEIGKLSKEWRNTSRNSNKMTTFGAKDEYNTNTAGIIDYTSSAFGFAYIHENETVKLGNGSGWYAGAVNNRFKFKDIGKSKETHTMLKAGMFRSKAFDHNNSLNWTVSGEGFVSRNEMDRKYLVVDQIFNAKSDYTVYGAAVKNEISKTFRTGEKFSVRPYGSLKLEYGRFNRIKEESGQMRLEVKGNDYISVKPETGVEFRYVQPMAVKTTFVTSLGLGYGNELGRVSQKNSLKVKGTNAGWYNLKEEKEDRKGSFKADLNIGVENQRFGVTVNAGYDTKGKNARGGVGFRVMY